MTLTSVKRAVGVFRASVQELFRRLASLPPSLLLFLKRLRQAESRDQLSSLQGILPGLREVSVELQEQAL